MAFTVRPTKAVVEVESSEDEAELCYLIHGWQPGRLPQQCPLIEYASHSTLVAQRPHQGRLCISSHTPLCTNNQPYWIRKFTQRFSSCWSTAKGARCVHVECEIGNLTIRERIIDPDRRPHPRPHRTSMWPATACKIQLIFGLQWVSMWSDNRRLGLDRHTVH